MPEDELTEKIKSLEVSLSQLSVHYPSFQDCEQHGYDSLKESLALSKKKLFIELKDRSRILVSRDDCDKWIRKGQDKAGLVETHTEFGIGDLVHIKDEITEHSVFFEKDGFYRIVDIM